MYFKSREQAGQLLAKELTKYASEPCIIIVLSDGGVVVATQIADKLHCAITFLLTSPIKLPGEPDPIAMVNEDGGFTYNNMYSAGQLEEFKTEYYNYIEQAKRENIGEIHRLLGKDGLVRKDLLRHHNIILVSDGFINGFSLDSVVDYLKTINIKRLIVATPLSSVKAVDRMHIVTDEIHCLNVLEDYFGTNHYYDQNPPLSHEKLMKTIENISIGWK